MSHSICTLCFQKVIISLQFWNNYGQSAPISLEAKHRITHGEWNWAACMCETFVVCCYSYFLVQYQILHYHCISCRSETIMWEDSLSTFIFLSYLSWWMLWDFSNFNTFTCRSSWEWLQFISQVGYGLVMGERTRGKLNSSCRETGKCNLFSITVPALICPPVQRFGKGGLLSRQVHFWQKHFRFENNFEHTDWKLEGKRKKNISFEHPLKQFHFYFSRHEEVKWAIMLTLLWRSDQLLCGSLSCCKKWLWLKF